MDLTAAAVPFSGVSALAAIAALPVAYVVVWATLRTRFARRVVAAPTGERWSTETTPSLGGVGIVAGILAGVGLCLAVGEIHASWELFGILAGCLILFTAGLVDDLRTLTPPVKIGAQLAAAAVVLSTGLKVQLVSNPVLGVAIALAWLVGMTNAFNLLDNMDGLAATLAAIGAFAFAIDAVTQHPNDLVLVLSLAVGFACLGFLPFNLRVHGPALIFMGDSGSQVLGFALAAIGLAGELEDRRGDRDLALPADPDPRRADPRHDARDRDPPAGGAPGHARAAATTPRTGSSTPASPRSARSSSSP